MHSKAEGSDDQIGLKLFFFLFMIVFIIYFVHEFRGTLRNEAAVWAGYQKTTGWIVSYYDRHNSDAGSGRNITYSYRVGEKEYSRDVYTLARFDVCDGNQETSDGCARKRFWVLYSEKQPDKSLINFQNEVQDLPDQELPPEALKEFY